MKKRTFMQAAIVAAATLAWGSHAVAQEFPPKKPITMVVGFAAGVQPMRPHA